MAAQMSGEAGRTVPRRAGARTRTTLCLGYLALLAVIALTRAEFFAVVGGVVLFTALAMAFGIRSATRKTLARATRRAWWLLSAAFLLLNLAPLGMAVPLDADAQVDAQVGLSAPPSVGDLIRLLAVVPILVALFTFPRNHTTARDNHKLLLDVLTVIGGSFMLLWYCVLGPVLSSRVPVVTIVVSAAYPISALVLIFGATVVLLRGAHLAIRRPMTMLLTGLPLLALSDTYLGYSKARMAGEGTMALHAVTVIAGLCLMTGRFLLALAAFEQCVLAAADGQRASRPRPAGTGSWLPYAALAVGSVLLCVVATRSGLYPWGGLIGGAVIMTAAVALRQAIGMRENRKLIISDALTGLSNRVRLYEALDSAVDRAERTGERIAVLLIDMNGFKQINDTLGHEAGDQLLVGFAGLLRANVLGSDTVARLGGDEFAVVLHNVGTPDNAAAVASRIITGMGVPIPVNGEPVLASASIGIAITRADQSVLPAEVLHQADLAMYQAKAAGGNTYRFHAGDSTAAPRQAVEFRSWAIDR